MHKLGLSTLLFLAILPGVANADLPPTPQPLFEDDSCICQNRNFGCVNVDHSTGLVEAPQFDDSPRTRPLLEAQGFSKMCTAQGSNAKVKTNEVWCPPTGKQAILAARAAAHNTVAASASPPKATTTAATTTATTSVPAAPLDQRLPARRGCAVSAPNAPANEVGSGILGYLALALLVVCRTRAQQHRSCIHSNRARR
jgi:hypothetical protein